MLKGKNIKQKKVKMKSKHGAQDKVEIERGIGHLSKWTKRRRGGGEMLGGFIRTRVDLIIFFFFSGKIETVVGKAVCLIWDSGDVTAQAQHEL